MPLQLSSAPRPSAEKKFFYSPFTDDIREVEEPFQIPNELCQTRIDAAVARAISQAEANADDQAEKALRKEWGRLRESGTWNEDGVREYGELIKELNDKNIKHHLCRLFASLVEKELRVASWAPRPQV